jgi:hypothetical protein
MDASFPFTGDGAGAGAGAMGGVSTITPPSFPSDGIPGIPIDGDGGGAGAGAGAGPGIGASADCGAPQASNVAASIIKVDTINNLFIRTSRLLYSTNKTELRAKSYYLGKAPQLTAAYFNR